MSSIVVEAHRKRLSVKATPMMPLSAVVADALAQLKLTGEVAPEACRLSLRGKAVDMSTPVRFANIGRDKLELTTGREPALGVQTAQPPAAAAAALAPQAPPAAGDMPGAGAGVDPAAQQQQQQATAPPGAGSVAPPAAAAAAAAAPERVATDAASAAAAAAAEAAAAVVQHPSVALFGRRVHVFTRQAEMEAEAAELAGGQQGAAPDAPAAAAAAAADEDESFFDFTEADLRRAMASQATHRAQQQSAHLMTSAMREREARRRAEAAGDVQLRLYLPDPAGHVLQAALPATAPLADVLALARAALAPEAAAAAYIFTTPPRTVIKGTGLAATLYAAKLVPAAKLHVGLDADKLTAAAASCSGDQIVRPEVAALAAAPPRRADVMHAGGAGSGPSKQGAAAGGTGGSGAGNGGASGSGAAGAAQVQKGVPKWMKLR